MTAITLFGGIIAVLVLHFSLGRMGGSNYWRGVVSGAVPSFVFLGYSLFHAMTLDILSIHLALFLSTATVLTLVIGARKKSDGSGIHWTIKIMIVFFLILFIVDGAFVSISTNGVPPEVAAWFLPNADKNVVYTGFTGVTRHGEEAASAESRALKAQDEMRKLGWKIEIDGVNDLSVLPTAHNSLRVLVLDPQGMPVNGAKVGVEFLRSDTQQPTPIQYLTQQADGEYRGDLHLQAGGNWILRTIILIEGKQVQVDHDVKVATS